jgi:DivIVA domain-containing protein
VSPDRFQRPSTPAGARAAAVTDLPPHPPDVRDEEVDAVLEAEFPIALRGYDRTAVDAYVQRANRVIAELRASSSPQAAVRYALEQVSEETRAILQQAHDAADAMTTKARAESADQLEAAQREAAQLREAAERYAADTRAGAERDAADVRASADRRVHEVEDDVVEIWQERERLVDDARDIAARLAELAEEAAARELPSSVVITEADTHALPAPPMWDEVTLEDEDRDGLEPPAPMLRAVPPPPAEASPEPSLAGAPPPGSVVPEGDTVEFPPPAQPAPRASDEDE